MAKLIYSAIASADGYIEDAAGSFDWAAPDQDVLRFVNDLERPVGTYLYGRRMYETMLYWETAHTVPGQPPFVQEFTGIWQAADKIVFSKTLASVLSARTRIERDFDAALVRQLKSATERARQWGARTWRGRPSMLGWSTSCSCSWFPSSSEAASGHCPAVPAWIWTCWTRIGSQTVLSTSGTAPSQRDHSRGAMG
jgi:dihydrofolate reductase